MIITWADNSWSILGFLSVMFNPDTVSNSKKFDYMSTEWFVALRLHYAYSSFLWTNFTSDNQNLTKLSLYSFLWGTLSGFLPLIKIGVLRQDISITKISICFNVPISVFACKIWRLKVILINPYFIRKSLKAKLQIIHHSWWNPQFLPILVQLEIP